MHLCCISHGLPICHQGRKDFDSCAMVYWPSLQLCNVQDIGKCRSYRSVFSAACHSQRGGLLLVMLEILSLLLLKLLWTNVYACQICPCPHRWHHACSPCLLC